MNFINFQCQYLDTHNSQKSVIYKYSQDRLRLKNTASFFVVSTCLRHEVYSFGPLNLSTHQRIANSEDALVRLIRLACGIESDIIGEQEILFQTERGVRRAFEKDMLNRRQLDMLLDVIATAESLRQRYDLTSKENYSTIAARLIGEHLAQQESPTLMVVGAGYMSRFFLDNINLKNVQLIWVNRNLGKIVKNHSDILAACADYVLALPKDLLAYIRNVDGVFVAVSHYHETYDDSKLNLRPSQLAVDISYPIVFNNFDKAKVLNLANTNFQSYVASVPSTKILSDAHNDIERVAKKLLEKWSVE